MKKSILFLVTLLSLAITGYAQQKPPYNQSNVSQVGANKGTWPRYFMGLPHGSTPVMPPWVPDSLKDGALYRDTIAHVTYSFNKSTGLWEVDGGDGGGGPYVQQGQLYSNTSENFVGDSVNGFAYGYFSVPEYTAELGVNNPSYNINGIFHVDTTGWIIQYTSPATSGRGSIQKSIIGNAANKSIVVENDAGGGIVNAAHPNYAISNLMLADVFEVDSIAEAKADSIAIAKADSVKETISGGVDSTYADSVANPLNYAGGITVTTLPGAGTGATVTYITNGHQVKISLTTGTTPTSTYIFRISVGNPLSYTPYPALAPANAAAAALYGPSAPYVNTLAGGSHIIEAISGTTPLAASTAYVWYLNY